MSRHLRPSYLPGQTDQDSAVADMFGIPTENRAFHEKWAPLGRPVPGSPPPSEASGYATHREQRLDAQVDKLRREVKRLQKENEEYHFICNMVAVENQPSIIDLACAIYEQDQQIKALKSRVDKFRKSSRYRESQLHRASKRRGAKLSKYMR